MDIKKVGLASDHAGFAMKEFVKQYLDEKGIPYHDYGTYSEESTDYPDYGHQLARGIENGDVYPGIAVCATGEGMSMTLNKYQHIRAALCWIPKVAHLTRAHNNANVLVLPGKIIDNDTARAIMDEYFSTDFEGGRHLRRINKIPVDAC
ncbi:MAG: ribose 5-phosphate isomerase B [Prevotella sp.]|nr:ribose 5-phosphate isomerase B [Prevotella sp.]MDD3387789.1 ribose 5-phosphate isomerase B [Prevotella sp.]MDT3388245.1 ribose 5-phosphate isomerase B [Bacteroidota bacterium]